MSEIQEIQKLIRAFRDERDWMQFHNPKDMAVALSIEASELLELFLWKSPAEVTACVETKRERVEEEIADIAVYLFELADNLGINLSAAIKNKVAKNALNYPAATVRGSSKKYTEYSAKKRPRK
jgi:NTP pyrophosphatase (non-canonical NTP hydrolase)